MDQNIKFNTKSFLVNSQNFLDMIFEPNFLLFQFTGPKSVEAQVQGTVRINCSVVWDPASELEVSWKKDNVRYYALKLIVL